MTRSTAVAALDAMWPVGRALARVLQKSDSIRWTGLAGDTATWRDMLSCFRPDVALIDPLGFGLPPAELARITRASSPTTKIAIFAPTLAEPTVGRWYDAGADACIAKWMHPDLIVEIIDELRRGTFCRSSISRLLTPSATAS